ncbi:hypothetical protein [Azospirillum argentinense]|uniref:hypothetical protein n=1 Tax=Azospirillum argentinense TaxID=2970906 RepID=UPI001586DBF7|nr:hypothetical protein [Azospirillum argentinense]
MHHVPPEGGGAQVVRSREFDEADAADADGGLAQFFHEAGREQEHVVIDFHDGINTPDRRFVPQVRRRLLQHRYITASVCVARTTDTRQPGAVWCLNGPPYPQGWRV